MAGTRERIITEAMRLFAERGYKGTSVAAIEEAAGLSPGSGALYKHFRSKEDVLRAGVASYLDRLDGVREATASIPLGVNEPGTGMRFAGAAAMAEITAHPEFNRILFRELDRFPELLSDVRERLIHATYRDAASSLQRQAKAWGMPGDLDFEALSIVSLGSLLYYRLIELLFGAPPGDVDEDRVLDAWLEVWTTYIGAKTEEREQ